MKLTKKLIDSFSSIEYAKYHKEIRAYFKKDRLNYQLERENLLDQNKKDINHIDSVEYAEERFINSINYYYWNNRKDSIHNSTNTPWVKHRNNASQRCTNPKNKSYKYYGGKGIKYLLNDNDLKMLWIRDKAYLMEKPSLDRINPDKHYTYENCQFLEMLENSKKALKNK